MCRKELKSRPPATKCAIHRHWRRMGTLAEEVPTAWRRWPLQSNAAGTAALRSWAPNSSHFDSHFWAPLIPTASVVCLQLSLQSFTVLVAVVASRTRTTRTWRDAHYEKLTRSNVASRPRCPPVRAFSTNCTVLYESTRSEPHFYRTYSYWIFLRERTVQYSTVLILDISLTIRAHTVQQKCVYVRKLAVWAAVCATWLRVCIRTRLPPLSAWRATRTTTRCRTSWRSTRATARRRPASPTEARDETRSDRTARSRAASRRSTPRGRTRSNSRLARRPPTCRRRDLLRTGTAQPDAHPSTCRSLWGTRDIQLSVEHCMNYSKTVLIPGTGGPNYFF